METIKTTFEKLRMFNLYSSVFLQEKKENEKTKMGYAIKRTVEQDAYKKIFKEYNDEIDEKRIDLCLSDKNTGAVLLEEKSNAIRPYRYDKEGLKAIIKAENDILEKWDKKEFEIKVYFTSEIPEDLDDAFIERFSGIIISQ